MKSREGRLMLILAFTLFSAQAFSDVGPVCKGLTQGNCLREPNCVFNCMPTVDGPCTPSCENRSPLPTS